MSLFNTTGGSAFGTTSGTTAFGAVAAGGHNPNKDFEVCNPPEDSVSSLAFSPAAGLPTLLVAGSWDSSIRCWEVHQSGLTVLKAQQAHQAPVLDLAWSDDGTKVFSASCDKTAKVWDLASNQAITVAQHEAPIKTVHWIKGTNYSCLMTGSWDKTLKFWDTRTPNPMLTINLPERCYCADVLYPMAVVSTAGRAIIVYHLENTPTEVKKIESSLKFQHRCISIFTDKKSAPTGFALGSVEGRVAIQYVDTTNPKDNFTFKCHRSNGTTNGYQDIYAVNDIAFHPTHGTLATVGSDGRFSFWDKDARTKLKTSEQVELPITRCCFDARGEIFAYSSSYDWSKGHEFHNPQKKNYIFLHSCFDDLKPRIKK
ncbi:RAE1 [Cordylochernes scorpioides]|uniref:RAE1 n=1 Tax=Cordylochernes scorpioides TaxID=51811 RepID=A0ABY6LJN9_9ARAC|nr:RAE1 [Cordylochernes scorpioides]